MSIFGSFLFAFLMIVRVAQMLRNGVDLLGILLAGQAGIAAFCMIFRLPAAREARLPVQILAWLSAILPLAMQITKGMLGWLAAPGLFLALWSMRSLGSSFSVAPATRKLITRGPYRFIRHPMYAGEIFSLFGACLASLSVWNWFVLGVFGLSIYLRILAEESLLEEYAAYSGFVKWRIVPGVW
jgi:protein-S-isoprenylcysteine O-methyltransferase Ste14